MNDERQGNGLYHSVSTKRIELWHLTNSGVTVLPLKMYMVLIITVALRMLVKMRMFIDSSIHVYSKVELNIRKQGKYL